MCLLTIRRLTRDEKKQQTVNKSKKTKNTVDAIPQGDQSVSAGSLDRGDVARQLDRILVSPEFSASPRRRDLLAFIVSETLEGRGHNLKGSVIAVDVFGRDASTFDAQSDPVVRIEARRLRRDLDSYYSDQGAQDPIRISIPKGQYSALFERLHTERSFVEGVVQQQSTVNIGLDDQASPVPAGSLDHTSTGADAQTAGMPGKFGFGLAFLAFALALGAFAWFQLPSRVAPGASYSSVPSVIVLPFEPLTSGEDDRFIAAGLTQEIIHDLRAFQEFRLYSLNTSNRLTADADAKTLSVELPVA